MFVLGLLLESGQHLSPGRSVDLGDVIANGAGVVSGVLKAISTRILL
jgi:VanZ family protein